MKIVVIEGVDSGFDVGIEYFNESLGELLKADTFPKNRVGDIVDYIEKVAVDYHKLGVGTWCSLIDLEPVFDTNPDLVVKLREKGRYLIRSMKGFRTVLRVYDVDESKDWVMEDGRLYYIVKEKIEKEIGLCRVIKIKLDSV